MDKFKGVVYNSNNIKINEVVKMVAIPHPRTVNKKTNYNQPANKFNKQKKKSAMEISESVGVYSAFGRTLSDLHKQGK